MNSKISKSIAVIVAHPDDETLWAGGTILSHPNHNWYIVCLCRASDSERATRFYETLKILNAKIGFSFRGFSSPKLIMRSPSTWMTVSGLCDIKIGEFEW